MNSNVTSSHVRPFGRLDFPDEMDSLTCRFVSLMKSSRCCWWLTALLLAGILIPRAAAATGPNAKPSVAISEIRAVAGELIVTVHVSAGQRRVRLESRPRIGRGAWTPRAVQWSDGTEADLIFRLAAQQNMELLRALGDAESDLGLPASFFSGPSSFSARTETNSGGAGGGLYSFDSAGAPTLSGPSAGNSSLILNPSTRTADLSRAVVESDIWKLDGSTLYFFNQQRGLQVIDVTHPDQPALLGTLPLAVWGEQMYRLPAITTDGSVWLALLTQQGCAGNGSEVLLVNVKDNQPRLANRLPVRGQIRETRLVGDALYLATYDWSQPPPQPVYKQGTVVSYLYLPWESATIIQGFNLADPAQPGRSPTVELAANPDAIMATEQFLFVATTARPSFATTEINQHSVTIFDISDPKGAVTPMGNLAIAGFVDSKFKLGLEGNIFTVVSQADGVGQNSVHTNKNGSVWMSWDWLPPRAVLETFNLSNPSTPAPLGKLTLVTNENVYATRLVGDRAYVVTFHRTDPLWIVDLADPTQPTVKGELQVPGYSSYLQPMGDRLLALGVEGNRTMVQLFDVADAAHPALLDKVPLGEGWSWSEGNSDEKAFQVFPEAGLLLVPWQGGVIGDNGGKWFQGIQLVDFDLAAGKLKARGVIDHAFQARRATLIGDRVISISSQDLLSANVANRDLPQVTADLELSPVIERVLVNGDRLLQIQENGIKSPKITLTTAAAAQLPLSILSLINVPMIGASWHDDHLAVLQLLGDQWRNDPQLVTNQVPTEIPQPPAIVAATNYDVIEIPQPPLISYRFSTNIITYPPLPLDPNPPRIETNIYTFTVTTPQPSITVTNINITLTKVEQPSLWTTNAVVTKVDVYVRVPGELIFSLIGVENDSLHLLSQVRAEVPTNFYGGAFQAFWPRPDLLVWTETANGYNGFGWNDSVPFFRGGISFVSDNVQIGSFTRNLPYFWNPWFGRGSRTLLAYDLSTATAPTLASITRMGDGLDWNGFRGPFLADGKLFLGHDESKYLSTPEGDKPLPPTGNDVAFKPIVEVQVGVWEYRHYLDAVDFADAANPVIRTPVNVPGTLQGVSHGGQLVYVEGISLADPKATTPELHALAYDGLTASYITSLPLPTNGSRPLLIREDGKILLGRAAATTNDLPALETWAVNRAGTFSKYGSTTLAATAEEFHSFGELLIVPASDQYFHFDLSHLPELTSPGVVERPCGLYFDWSKADASTTTGLWIPRGQSGLWSIPWVP